MPYLAVVVALHAYRSDVTTPNATTTEFTRRCRHCGEALDPASSFCSKCGATAELPGATGDSLRESLQSLFGRELEIQDELGRGGMAAVYAAFDPVLQRRVAVKVLLPEMAAETGMADKFLREARTVAALQHPHVVTVYGVRANDAAQAIVMQFVEGRSLDRVLKGRSQLPVPVAALILSQAASGLQHAHDRGIVHRDVKPANVLLDHDGRAIVSDFGIARRDTAPRTTATGFVIGTWAYMSPEQRMAKPVSAATDQYAFGVMAFEILTGGLPFTGTVPEVLIAHLEHPPPSLRERRAELSASVEALVQRMMAKDPAARFPSLRDAERILRAHVPDENRTTQVIASYSHVQVAGGSAVLRVARVPRVPGLVSNSVTEAAAAETVRMPEIAAPSLAAAPRSRLPSLIAAAAGAVVLILGGLIWTRTHARTDTARPEVAAASATATQPNEHAAAPAGQLSVAPSPPPASTTTSSNAARVAAAPTNKGPSNNSAGASTAASLPRGGTSADTVIKVQPSPPTAAATPSGAVPRADSSSARPAGAAPTAGALAVSATIADARAAAKAFAALMNQGQWRDIDQLGALDGDAALRAEIIRLVRTAREFTAGFDRLASTPVAAGDGFATECTLALDWRGGQRLVLLHLRAERKDGAWHIAAFGVEPVQ
jgi:eukaryotic-like serine/threonine-protein kinase